MKALILGAVVAVFGGLSAAFIFAVALAFSFIIALFSGTLIYWLWSWAAPLYFDFMPEKYIHIPWWHVVLLAWLFRCIGAVLFKSSGQGSSDSKKE